MGDVSSLRAAWENIWSLQGFTSNPFGKLRSTLLEFQCVLKVSKPLKKKKKEKKEGGKKKTGARFATSLVGVNSSLSFLRLQLLSINKLNGLG